MKGNNLERRSKWSPKMLRPPGLNLTLLAETWTKAGHWVPHDNETLCAYCRYHQFQRVLSVIINKYYPFTAYVSKGRLFAFANSPRCECARKRHGRIDSTDILQVGSPQHLPVARNEAGSVQRHRYPRMIEKQFVSTSSQVSCQVNITLLILATTSVPLKPHPSSFSPLQRRRLRTVVPVN